MSVLTILRKDDLFGEKKTPQFCMGTSTLLMYV
jgi:hypothetical protein